MSRQASRPQDDTTPRRILAAAARLMGESGYDGTSVQAIAQLADVNKALVFYHFGNKAKLFERVLEHQLEGLHDALRAALATSNHETAPAVALHALLDGYIDYVEANPAYARLVQLELAHANGRHDLIGRHNRANFKLVEGVVRPLVTPGSPQSAEQLFITFGGIVLHYFVSAPVLAPVLSKKGSRAGALSPAALATRRAHVHWMVDATVAALLTASRAAARAAAPHPVQARGRS